MKRIGIAVGLLLVVIVLSGAGLLLQHHATQKLIADCDTLETLYESGDTDQCRIAAEDFSANLESAMRWFPFFLRHERLETVYTQAATLPFLAADEDRSDFMSALAAIRMQLQIVLDSEYPTLQNIL